MNKQIKKELDEFVNTITPEKLETMLNEIDKEQEEFMEQQSMISQKESILFLGMILFNMIV